MTSRGKSWSKALVEEKKKGRPRKEEFGEKGGGAAWAQAKLDETATGSGRKKNS